MSRTVSTISLILTLAFVPTMASRASQPPADDTVPTLLQTIADLDEAVFSSFNQCQSPEQLQRHAGHFASDVEFYHDTGGVTWTREAMLANTAKNVCGKIRRELVAGTLEVFPIKDHGAIAQGVHRFCRIDTGQCEGQADFVMVWREQDDQWQITRVLSYDHRPIHAEP